MVNLVIAESGDQGKIIILHSDLRPNRVKHVLWKHFSAYDLSGSTELLLDKYYERKKSECVFGVSCRYIA